MLQGLGKGEATTISVPDSAAAVKAFHDMAFNGDGVIPAESTRMPEQKQLVLDVIATIGSTDDKSGKKGVNADQVKSFFTAVGEYVGWLARGEADAALMPLQGDTVVAFESMKVVRAKVDDFFARCAMAAFDSRAAAALNREEKEYLAVAAKDLTITSEEIKGFPLSKIEGHKALPLFDNVNPAWAAALATFAAKTLTPLLGEQKTLTEAQWAEVKAKLAAFEAWQGSKVGGVVEKLGVERLKALDTPAAKALLDALFAEEKAQEPTANSIASVEKLVRYTRDLFQLANNFVSFKDFYERKRPAIFQVGTLFLDQRECELVIRVEDAARHATMAPLSRGFLAYCDCARPATGEKMSIVAAFTAGESDNLMVGRNGLFKDREGKDWDATITKLVDNPISIRQAFWSPYKKVLRFVEEQVAKRAAEEEKDSNALLAEGVTTVGKAGEEGKLVKEPKKLDIGVVAALGVAVGGITAAIGALLQSFFGLGFWMPLGVVGLLGLISGPVDVDRLAQAASAQHRPAARRERLGGQRARDAQHPLRRVAHQDGGVARGQQARHARSVRRGPPAVEALPRAHRLGGGGHRLVPGQARPPAPARGAQRGRAGRRGAGGGGQGRHPSGSEIATCLPLPRGGEGRGAGLRSSSANPIDLALHSLAFLIASSAACCCCCSMRSAAPCTFSRRCLGVSVPGLIPPYIER